MSSARIYRDSLRFDGRRPDLTLFLAPDVSNAEVLDSPEYQAAQRLRRAADTVPHTNPIVSRTKIPKPSTLQRNPKRQRSDVRHRAASDAETWRQLISHEAKGAHLGVTRPWWPLQPAR